MNQPVIFTQSLFWQIGTLAAGAILTTLILAIGHWFPLPHRLPRIQAYIYGTTAIIAGFALWRLLNGDWITIAGLVIVATAGGITVILAYKIDDIVARLRQAHQAQAADEELQ
jgi:hypothetical protein